MQKKLLKYAFDKLYQVMKFSYSGGYDMWKAAMLAYAEQLEKRQKYHQSALYFVAIGDVHKAVNLLKDNGHFK